MKRLLLFLSLTLWGSVPTSLLEIEAKLYPRILLLEQPLPLKQERLLIHIIYDKPYEEAAKEYAKLLLKQKLPYSIDVKLFPFPTKDTPSAFIIIHSQPDEIFQRLKRYKRPIFCILPKDIQWCTHSIAIDTRVVPLINPKLIKEFRLKFDPILYSIGKFYEE